MKRNHRNQQEVNNEVIHEYYPPNSQQGHSKMVCRQKMMKGNYHD
jgi:hypothetical protein